MLARMALLILVSTIFNSCSDKTAQKESACSSSKGEPSIVRAVREVEVLDTPGGQRVRNELASAALRREVFRAVDPSSSIERVCSEGGWTKITAKDLKFTGWVRDVDIEPVSLAKDDSRVYDAKEITFLDEDLWSPAEKAQKSKLSLKFNELAKECQTLEKLIMRGPESSPGSPLFNFTCDDGGPHFIPYSPDAGKADAQ